MVLRSFSAFIVLVVVVCSSAESHTQRITNARLVRSEANLQTDPILPGTHGAGASDSSPVRGAVTIGQMFFVTDCTPYSRWMAFQLFNGARGVGHTERITWVKSGCSDESTREADERLAQHVYHAEARVNFIANGADQSQFISKMGMPLTVKAYVGSWSEQDVPNTTVVAMLEADHFFVRRFTLEDFQEGRDNANPPIRHQGQLIGGFVGASGYYGCCDGIGPPYVFTAEAWRVLGPAWELASRGKFAPGLGADQQMLATVVKDKGVKVNLLKHFMVSSPSVETEGWYLLEPALKNIQNVSGSDRDENVCRSGVRGRPWSASTSPIFLHLAQVMQTGDTNEHWGFSKYQVPPGWRHETKTDGILECGMPLFALPPVELIEKSRSSLEARNAWSVCLAHFALNDMLRRYKEKHCGDSGYNTAMAIKMKVPLTWTNELLSDAMASAPNGTDPTWLHACATVPNC